MARFHLNAQPACILSVLRLPSVQWRTVLLVGANRVESCPSLCTAGCMSGSQVLPIYTAIMQKSCPFGRRHNAGWYVARFVLSVCGRIACPVRTVYSFIYLLMARVYSGGACIQWWRVYTVVARVYSGGTCIQWWRVYTVVARV